MSSYQTYYYNGMQGLGNTGRLQTAVRPPQGGMGQISTGTGSSVAFAFLGIWLLWALANK